MNYHGRILSLLIALVMCGNFAQAKQLRFAPGPNLFGVTNPHAGSLVSVDTTRSNDKGNGGDVVVCYATSAMRKWAQGLLQTIGKHETSEKEIFAESTLIQLLDVYEYTRPSGFPPKVREVLQPTGDLTQAYKDVLARTAKKSSISEDIIGQQNYLPPENWLQVEGVSEVNDSDLALLLPPTCLLVQFAVRKDNVVYYDRNLFEHPKMMSSSKLAFLFHELLYSKFDEPKHSRFVRQAVGLLVSKDEFNALAPIDIYKRLSVLGDFAFPHKINSATAWIKKVSLVEGKVTTGMFHRPLTLSFQGHQFVLAGEYYHIGFELDPTGTQLKWAYLTSSTFPGLSKANLVRLVVESPGKLSIESADYKKYVGIKNDTYEGYCNKIGLEDSLVVSGKSCYLSVQSANLGKFLVNDSDFFSREGGYTFSCVDSDIRFANQTGPLKISGDLVMDAKGQVVSSMLRPSENLSYCYSAWCVDLRVSNDTPYMGVNAVFDANGGVTRMVVERPVDSNAIVALHSSGGVWRGAVVVESSNGTKISRVQFMNGGRIQLGGKTWTFDKPTWVEFDANGNPKL